MGPSRRFGDLAAEWVAGPVGPSKERAILGSGPTVSERKEGLTTSGVGPHPVLVQEEFPTVFFFFVSLEQPRSVKGRKATHSARHQTWSVVMGRSKKSPSKWTDGKRNARTRGLPCTT